MRIIVLAISLVVCAYSLMAAPAGASCFRHQNNTSAMQRFRAKYPQYNDISDRELAAKIVAKYPQYRKAFARYLDPKLRKPSRRTSMSDLKAFMVYQRKNRNSKKIATVRIPIRELHT